MNIKTFQAIDMRTAMARVKEELGSNAIILGTKQLARGEGSYGSMSRPMIEVTAALDEDETPPPARKKTAKTQSVAKTARKTTSDENPSLDELKEEIVSIKRLLTSTFEAGFGAESGIKQAAGMADELENLKSMLSFMMENSDFYKGTGLEPNYLACYRRMVERGVDREFAMKLAHETRESVPGNRELDLKSLVTLFVNRIKDAMITSGPITPLDNGSPRIISLIGPTGVGKTTTAAKIAARLTMADKKVGLITIDTYRIAAVEQLRTYAGILGVPIEVAGSPEELTDAVERMGDMDVIIIDTAGRSQHDSEKLSELDSFLKAGPEIENLLVLSAAADPAAINEAVRNFGKMDVAGVIFTKMDETSKPGVVITQNFKTGIPIVYCTAGQRVPEDIETASAQKIAALLFKKQGHDTGEPAGQSIGGSPLSVGWSPLV
jgi:flagellar biosynthesis protein FlhF